MDKDERNGLVGSDEHDLSINDGGLTHVFSPELLIARKRARKWLLQQRNANMIFFSFDRTMDMIVDQDLKAGWKVGDVDGMSDAEADAFNDCTQQQARLEEAWHSKVNEEYLKVSDQESALAWADIVAACNKVSKNV